MLILDGLGATPFILALLYLGTTVLIASRLRNLHARHPEMNTTKLFVLSVLLSCTMRCLSFIALGAFSVQSITIDNDSSGGSSSSPSSSSYASQDPDTQFYEKVRKSLRNPFLPPSSPATRLHDLPPLPQRVVLAFLLPSLTLFFLPRSLFPQALLILFNLPDFVFVSAYVLLALVWAETFIQSRSHWLSVKQFRRMWLLSYLIFNACLYLGQLVLYTLLFLPKGNQEFLSKIIFLTLCVINFSLPIILLLLFFYLSIMFAGFPYKSRGAPARLNQISKVGLEGGREGKRKGGICRMRESIGFATCVYMCKLLNMFPYGAGKGSAIRPVCRGCCTHPPSLPPSFLPSLPPSSYQVMVWWTIGRIIWGILVLTTILQGWLTNAHRDRQVYSVVLVGLFLITEWIPFFVAMDVSLLASLSAEGGKGGRDGGREGGEVGTYGTLLVPDLDEEEEEEEDEDEDEEEEGEREGGREGRGGDPEKSRRSDGDRNEAGRDEVEEEEEGREDVEEGRSGRIRASDAGTGPAGGGGLEGVGDGGGRGGGGGGGGFLLYPSTVKT